MLVHSPVQKTGKKFRLKSHLTKPFVIKKEVNEVIVAVKNVNNDKMALKTMTIINTKLIISWRNV